MNQMGIDNTDLGKQLRAQKLGSRLWRLRPDQASTRHRHIEQLWLVAGAPPELANTLR